MGLNDILSGGSVNNPRVKSTSGLSGLLKTRGTRETITQQKARLRSEGLPVSTRLDRATPTTGGSILRDVARVPATLLGRVPQLGFALAGASPEEQTLKSGYLGDIKTSKNAKDVLKDVGRGAELVSYGIGGGAIKDAAGNVVKQSFKQALPRLALEGIGAGSLGAGGHAISEGKPLKDVLKESAKGGLIGGALNIGVGGLSSILSKSSRELNKGSTFISKELTPEEAALAARERSGYTYNNKGRTIVPEVPRGGTTRNPINAEDNIPIEPHIPNEKLPVIDYGGTPEVPSEKAPPGYKYEVPKIPKVDGQPFRAEPFNTPNNVTPTLDQINRESLTSTQSPERVTPESPQFKEQEKSVTSDEFEQAKKNHEENYGDESSNKWTPKKWKEQIAYAKLLPEEIQKEIATGQLEPPEAVDRTFIWGEVKKRAEASGDGETLLAIRNSIASPSAQGSHLQFAKNAKSDIDVVDNLKNIINERKGSSGEKILNKAVKEGRAVLDKAKASAKDVEQFLKDLTCD